MFTKGNLSKSYTMDSNDDFSLLNSVPTDLAKVVVLKVIYSAIFLCIFYPIRQASPIKCCYFIDLIYFIG